MIKYRVILSKKNAITIFIRYFENDTILGITIYHQTICSSLHNVLFVQYIYLATEQAQTYRKSCSLIYLLTYICPSAFDCEVNAIFMIFVKSNSKSRRFSSFLMPNNLGTGQKKAYFLGALEN